MFDHRQRSLLGFAFLLLAAIPLWIGVVVPYLTKLPDDFSYRVNLLSFDDFYDEKTQQFSGPKRSASTFSYEVVKRKQHVLIVKNIFNVHTVTGEKIIAVERLYGIDPLSGRHVAGFGDHDRQGYLFAPRHLRKGQSFTYWHVNYDGPAEMTFLGEEMIGGLKVFRYGTRYEGTRIDQTSDLRFLPGVGVTRGIELEPYLQVWIEPVSGHLVTYSDDTVAYYYDLRTGERLHPWNHFRNAVTFENTLHHVELAGKEKTIILFTEYAPSALFALLAAAFLLLCFRNSKTARFVYFGIVVLAACTMAGLWFAPPSAPPSAGPPEKVRIGAEEGMLASAVWVAERKGYFKDQGLEAEIRVFGSGRAALASMLGARDLDIATVAQTPVALNGFQRNDFAIIAGMATSSNDVKILARKDRGSRDPRDLRGKKIGVTRNSTGHYFLGLYLTQHGLELQDVMTVDIEAPGLPQAIAEGRVDAIATWEPHIYNARKALDLNGLLLESEGTFREDFYFAVFKDWAKKNPQLLKKFLAAIDSANVFIAEHPKEAQDIVADRLKLDPALVATVWNAYSFRFFLDQAIVLSLEQHARWMKENGLVDEAVPPNYLDFIDPSLLEHIKPEAVTIIR